MRIFISLIIAILLSTTMVFSEPEITGTPSELIKFIKDPPDAVSISAEATYEVQADRAVIMISVITEDALLKKSLMQNQSLRAEIIERLKNSGISPYRISGTKFSSTPQYGIFGKKPSSYKVENVLKIIVENEKEFQYVASIIDSHEEVFYRELKFEHIDMDEFAEGNVKGVEHLHILEFLSSTI